MISNRDIAQRESYHANTPAPARQRTTIIRDPLHALRNFRQGNAAPTLGGFTAYRQVPDLGLSAVKNLFRNGGTNAGSTAITFGNPGAAYVVDNTSPTGAAVSVPVDAGGHDTYQDIAAEPGKTYSVAAWMRADGLVSGRCIPQWLDSQGNVIRTEVGITISSQSWTEGSQLAMVAPGNARTLHVVLRQNNPAGGVFWYSGVRAVQAATVPAWSAAMQNAGPAKGLCVYEGTTNISGPDADMEAAGVASYAAGPHITIAKDVAHFSGTQSLKVTGDGLQVAGAGADEAATFAASANTQYTVSARVKSNGVNNIKLIVYDQVGSQAAITGDVAPADWTTLSVTFTTGAGVTGLKIRCSLTDVAAFSAYFDQLACEQKAYNTLNSGDGREYTTGARAASSPSVGIPTGFVNGDFCALAVVRCDESGTGMTNSRGVFEAYVAAGNRAGVWIQPGGKITYEHRAGGVIAGTDDGGATAPAVGDTLSLALRQSPTNGLTLYVSKNGGAVATYNLNTADSRTAFTGAPTFYMATLGQGPTIFDLDGVIGIARLLRPETPDSVLNSLVANPYQAPTPYDLEVWTFDGAAAETPNAQPQYVGAYVAP